MTIDDVARQLASIAEGSVVLDAGEADHGWTWVERKGEPWPSARAVLEAVTVAVARLELTTAGVRVEVEGIRRVGERTLRAGRGDRAVALDLGVVTTERAHRGAALKPGEKLRRFTAVVVHVNAGDEARTVLVNAE